MVDQLEIEKTRRGLSELAKRLHSASLVAGKFAGKSTRPEIERQWMDTVFHSYDYSNLLIQSFLESVDSLKDLPNDRFGYYSGKVAIQHFLEMINGFEQILSKFISMDSECSKALEDRVAGKVDLIEKGWVGATGKGKKLKSSLINQLQHKSQEIAFIRETFFQHGLISDLDKDIWEFAWKIRNSMHRNFVALGDIDFQFPDIRTGVMYKFKYSKGQELHHPGDYLAFFAISEQLEFILMKILTANKV